MAMLRRSRDVFLLLPWLVVATAACGSSSPDGDSSGDGTSDDGGGSGGGGGAAASTATSSDASTSSGCLEDPPACENDDRVDDACAEQEGDCYAVTACTTVWCRRTVSCFDVEGSSGTDGEEVTVRDGQACALEGEECDGIADGVAHCTASATCEDGYWVQHGACEPDEEADE